MITNANLISYTAAGAPDRRGGGIAYGDAVTLNKRCALIDPSTADRTSKIERIASATAVLIVLRSVLGTTQLAARGRITALRDLQTTEQTFEISEVSAPTKAGGLSHFKCWLTEVKP